MKTTTKFKKLLSAALALIMVLGTLAMLPMTVSAEGLQDSATWDGSTKTQPAGDGTKDNPYQIASAENLAWLSYESVYMVPTEGTDVGVCYVKFTANIDLGNHSFKPIVGRRLIDADAGTYNYVAFIVDGQGATIKNLNMTSTENVGLFTFVGNGSSFSNINLVGAYVTTNSAEAVGALVGEACGYIDMYNCHIDATSTVKGIKAVGGLLGYVNPKNSPRDTEVNFTYCTSGATVECVTTYTASITPYVGGVFARIKTDVDANISYCYASGTVKVTKETAPSNLSVGGILGQISEANKVAKDDFASGDHFSMSHCVNEATIIVNAMDASAPAKATDKTYSWIGGLAGHFNLGVSADEKEYRAYHSYEVLHCFDNAAKVVTLSENAGPQITTVSYINGNHAGWQQTKAYKYVYGVKNANTTIEVSVGIPSNYHPPVEIDIGEASSLTEEISLNMTSTTVGDEINKIKTAISTLGEATIGGEAVDDGLERDYAWYTPEGGTKEAPYQIANAAAWMGLVELSLGLNADASGYEEAVDFDGKYFELTGDLDLTDYPLYPVGGKASIYLDGKNHVIKNADFSASSPALFVELGRDSTVKNLTFDNVNIEATGNAAFLAVDAKVGLTCYNIHVKDTCSIVSRGNIAAGLVARLVDQDEFEEGSMIDFRFCLNEADISAKQHAGGIVGILQGCYNYNFDFCVNKGDLATTGTNVMNSAGGIFAQFTRKENSVPNYGTITNCYNTGKLSCYADAGQYIMTGGIFGVLRTFNGSEVEIENCFDYSARYEKTADTKFHLWGGIAGNADNSQVLKIIYNCAAANDPSSEFMYGVVVRWTIGASTVGENYNNLKESVTDEIMNAWGETSTIKAEMEKIDAAIAELQPNDLSYEEGSQGETPAPTPSVPSPSTPSGEETEASEDKEDKADDADEADDGDEPDAPAEEGCGSSVSATFAVLALTAVCGMAVVGKKKED